MKVDAPKKSTKKGEGKSRGNQGSGRAVEDGQIGGPGNRVGSQGTNGNAVGGTSVQPVKSYSFDNVEERIRQTIAESFAEFSGSSPAGPSGSGTFVMPAQGPYNSHGNTMSEQLHRIESTLVQLRDELQVRRKTGDSHHSGGRDVQGTGLQNIDIQGRDGAHFARPPASKDSSVEGSFELTYSYPSSVPGQTEQAVARKSSKVQPIVDGGAAGNDGGLEGRHAVQIPEGDDYVRSG